MLNRKYLEGIRGIVIAVLWALTVAALYGLMQRPVNSVGDYAISVISFLGGSLIVLVIAALAIKH